MRADTYKLIQRCVEDGIRQGWRRAHKHEETPNETLIRDEIENAIMGEVCEWFVFPDWSTSQEGVDLRGT